MDAEIKKWKRLNEALALKNKRLDRALTDCEEALEELLACCVPTGMDTRTDRAMEKARAVLKL